MNAGLGQRLKQVRGRISQGAYAALLGIGKSALIEYENETRVPRLDVMVRVSELSGKSLDWIATGVEASRTLDTDILAQVIESVEAEQGGQDAATRAKLISLLYKQMLLMHQKEQDGNEKRKGSAA